MDKYMVFVYLFYVYLDICKRELSSSSPVILPCRLSLDWGNSRKLGRYCYPFYSASA